MTHTNKYLITPVSKNAKTGPIMVTTSPRKTCPTACPFKSTNQGGCYAEGGPLGGIWRGLDATEPGDTFKNGKGHVQVKSLAELIEAIEAQQEGALWRHNQAGDITDGVVIDHTALQAITDANRKANAKGFTYTHASMHIAENRMAVALANRSGFTVNLSANNLAHADTLAEFNAGPVAAVVPITQTTNTTTPKGRKVVICPATQRDDVSCSTCGLCARQRDFIIGFPAHGASKKKANATAAA